MWFFGWWGERSPWLRYGVGLVLIAISTAMYFSGWLWIWGWVVGALMLAFAGPSKSEKNGYRF
jgi:hypothetical protein